MADDDRRNQQPDQTGLYELEFPAPQLWTSDGRGPVMVHALEGFSDAGHAIHLAAQHLRDTSTPNSSHRSRSTTCWTIAPGDRR